MRQSKILHPSFSTHYWFSITRDTSNFTVMHNHRDVLKFQHRPCTFLRHHHAGPGPRGLLSRSSQFAGIKFHWNCCILLYIAMREIDSHIAMLQESLCQWFLSKVRPCHRVPCLAHVPMIKSTISSAIRMNNFI